MRAYPGLLLWTWMAAFAVATAVGCSAEPPPNPYENLPPVVTEVGFLVPDLPEDNFAWIHQQVLKPTCSNSGCHDGTFEPDFRTVGSSWNTLVNHPVIANNADMGFTRRVVPGDVAQSFLYERLTVNIPNTSGMMPLEVDASSDFEERRPEYLEAIQQWIDAGAPDVNGQVASSEGLSLPPQVHGFGVFPPDLSEGAYPRAEGPGIQPVLVEASNVQVFIAVTDDQLGLNDLDCRWALGADVQDASSAEDGGTFSEAPFVFNAPTFSGSTETYGLSATIDLTGQPPGTELTLQIRASDGDSDAFAPQDNSPDYIQLLYRLRIQS